MLRRHPEVLAASCGEPRRIVTGDLHNHGPLPILRGSLRSHLRMTAEINPRFRGDDTVA
jgi:hypothetical protein